MNGDIMNTGAGLCVILGLAISSVILFLGYLEFASSAKWQRRLVVRHKVHIRNDLVQLLRNEKSNSMSAIDLYFLMRDRNLMPWEILLISFFHMLLDFKDEGGIRWTEANSSREPVLISLPQ